MAKSLSQASTSRRRGRERTAELAPPSAYAGPDPASNISDDTFLEIFHDALAKKTEHEAAVATVNAISKEFAAILKKGKALGIMPQVIKDALADKKLEPGEIEARLAQQRRLYKLLRLPVGTQLTLEGAADAAAPDATSEAGEWFDKAYEAGVAGKPLTSIGIDEEHKYWPEALRGYSQGQRELGAREGAPTHVPQQQEGMQA